MGFYLNPPDCTPRGKSKWLKENGVALPAVPDWCDIPEDCCAICCVDNGPFEAAAIACDSQELNRFNHPEDDRPKLWFFIEKKIACENSQIEMKDFK